MEKTYRRNWILSYHKFTLYKLFFSTPLDTFHCLQITWRWSRSFKIQIWKTLLKIPSRTNDNSLISKIRKSALASIIHLKTYKRNSYSNFYIWSKDLAANTVQGLKPSPAVSTPYSLTGSHSNCTNSNSNFTSCPVSRAWNLIKNNLTLILLEMKVINLCHPYKYLSQISICFHFEGSTIAHFVSSLLIG